MSDEGKRARIRYVAIGDSFTEGVGDDLPGSEIPGESVRGWADLVAQGLADATGEPVQYANLAIRGRLLGPIISEQLEPALALEPTLISFNGGGNDMLRPGTDIPSIVARTEVALRRMLETPALPLLIAGADPTAGIPRGSRVHQLGEALADAANVLARRLDIPFCNNWADRELRGRQYWSADRLHLGPVGHMRVAANVLRALDCEPPSDWLLQADEMPAPSRREQLRYTREHVLPWVKRRLTGRSSGDGRAPKFAQWQWIEPRTAEEINAG